MSIAISLEFTPNPDTLKYALDQVLLEKGAASLTDAETAKAVSPLGARLFEVPGVQGVLIGRDFVTITVTDVGLMGDVNQGVQAALTEHLGAGLPVMDAAWKDQDHQGEHGEVERQIIEILDAQIRPAVALDGGDIVFDRFDEGVVYLQMKGSCAGCPSSLATLKQGIETRLRQSVPEVVEVRAV